MSALVAAISLLLLHYVAAQQSCVNTCTDSANVLTQLKTCNGCGTDDWACFCRCNQYMSALLSCAEQNCPGGDITNSIYSFCANQGVTLSNYSPTSSSPSTGAVSSLPTTGTTSAATTATSSSSSSFSTAAATSAIAAILSTAVPSSAQTESSAACFVNSQYSYYSTPTWYSSLPTQAQSYYSSMNQGNTAACTLSPAQEAAAVANSHHRSGLSGGAIAGIVIGAIVAAILLALLLLWCCLRRRRRSRHDRDAEAARRARSEKFEPRNVPPGQARSQGPYLGGKEGMNGMGGVNGVGRNNGIGGSSGMGGPNGMGGTNGMGGAYGAGRPNGVGATNGVAGPGMASNRGFPPVVGGAALGGGGGGNNGSNDPYSHTTTTTTRTIIRPRSKKPAATATTIQPARPPPQPLGSQEDRGYNNPPQSMQPQLNGPQGNESQDMPRNSTGRRVF